MKKSLPLAFGLASLVIAAPAFADGGLTFQIVGDTFSKPYQITNTSTAGERVTGFGVSLISPYGFDTVRGGFGLSNATPFAPSGGSDVTTGYTGPSTFADGSTSLAFTFNDFNVGESFLWDIDVDSPTARTISGRSLVGSTGYADFSNGLRGFGTFEALGSDGSQFVISTFSPTPGVPEPASWAMMIGGLGMIGGAMRRRYATPKVSFA